MRSPGYIVKQKKKREKRENYREYLQYTTLQVRKKGNVRKHDLPICAKGIQEELTVTNKHGYFLIEERTERKKRAGKEVRMVG